MFMSVTVSTSPCRWPPFEDPSSNAWVRNTYVFDLHMSFIIPGTAQLRLVNGSSRCSGRVEVLHNQQWGTVCDNSWDLSDAEVVCRQMGCGAAMSAPGSAQFGPGSNHIWLGDVECTGAEATLSECRSRMGEPINCHHGEDAGVVCSGNFFFSRMLLFRGVLGCVAGKVEGDFAGGMVSSEPG